MNKIVVLSGSPRKNGNTERLVASFVKGAADRNDVKVISACDGEIHPCIGCNTCFAREGNRCFRDDGMTAIYEALGEADTVIIASPVYFYGVSAQLKAVIDRLHTPLRNTFPVKRLGMILVGAAELPELFDSILVQHRLICRFFHLEDAGAVLVRGAREAGAVSEEDLAKAFEFGQLMK